MSASQIACLSSNNFTCFVWCLGSLSVCPFLCCLPVILLSLCLPACLSASLSPASIFLLPPMLSVCHPVCLSNDLPVLKSVCRLPPSFCYNSFSHSTCVVRLSSWVFVYWSVSLSPVAMTLWTVYICVSVFMFFSLSVCLISIHKYRLPQTVVSPTLHKIMNINNLLPF